MPRALLFLACVLVVGQAARVRPSPAPELGPGSAGQTEEQDASSVVQDVLSVRHTTIQPVDPAPSMDPIECGLWCAGRQHPATLPPTYYVNLDRDRKESMRLQQELGLWASKVVRVQAVDANMVTACLDKGTCNDI